MQAFMARVVAPEGHLVSEVIVMGTWSQGHSYPLTVHLDSFAVDCEEDVPAARTLAHLWADNAMTALLFRLQRRFESSEK